MPPMAERSGGVVAEARFLEQRPSLGRLRWWQPLAYVTRELARVVALAIPELGLGQGSRVLDFGCADSRYRGLLPLGAVLVGADLPGNPAADIALRPDGSVAVEDGTFDAVLSTQVLEHVADAAAYIAECRRVLRPGGRLLLSTHGLMWHHPDPVDYWRWTADGLRRQIERGGFRCVSLYGVVGLAAAGLQMFQDATYWHLPRVLRVPFGAAMQGLIRVADRLSSPQARARDAMVFVVVAERI